MIDKPDLTRPVTRSGRRLDEIVARLFWAALAALLAGYMFLGRGFAHIPVGPVYVGDVVLALGILSASLALLGTDRSAALRRIRHPYPVVVLLIAFMVLGAARTVPYIPTEGINALRDAVLWGYGAFALIIYLIADRATLETGLRAYASIVPVFALWLPVSFWIWSSFLAADMSTDYPLADIPLVFFKAQDMAVHAAAALAFTVIGLGTVRRVRTLILTFAVAIPLTWILFITSVQSRGALLAIMAAIVATAVWVRRPQRWAHVIAAGVVVLMLTSGPAFLESAGGSIGPAESSAPESSEPPASGSPPPGSPGASELLPLPHETPEAIPEPTSTPTGRTFDIGQVVENLRSVFGIASDPNLAGTRSFRLSWWSEIIDYTVFGPYFWTGKGFGINLADSDGFQPTLDHSLRAPHNSHMTTLARMGVPGFALWIALQCAWLVLLLRAIWRHRRAQDDQMAMAGAWVLVYWVAMMINTSFDPYLEGPQGGIWFWVIFGAGLLVMGAISRSGAQMRISLPGDVGWRFPFGRGRDDVADFTPARSFRTRAVETPDAIERVVRLRSPYRETGGESRVVAAERSLLESTGPFGPWQRSRPRSGR